MNVCHVSVCLLEVHSCLLCSAHYFQCFYRCHTKHFTLAVETLAYLPPSSYLLQIYNSSVWLICCWLHFFKPQKKTKKHLAPVIQLNMINVCRCTNKSYSFGLHFSTLLLTVFSNFAIANIIQWFGVSRIHQSNKHLQTATQTTALGLWLYAEFILSVTYRLK